MKHDKPNTTRTDSRSATADQRDIEQITLKTETKIEIENEN